MEHQRYFEEAFRHAFSSLPAGSVFGGMFRESKFTKHMKNDWQRPDGFETLLIGKDLANREVDFARNIDGKLVASCELKVYPKNRRPTHTSKPFTAVAEAILKQMIRRDEGIDASAFVAIALHCPYEEEAAALRWFESNFIEKIHAYLRVKCSGLSAMPLGNHLLFMWEVQPAA